MLSPFSSIIIRLVLTAVYAIMARRETIGRPPALFTPRPRLLNFSDEGGGLRLDPRLRRLHRVCVDPCLEIFRVDYLSHYLHYSFRMIGGVEPHPKISQNALAAASISRIYP